MERLRAATERHDALYDAVRDGDMARDTLRALVAAQEEIAEMNAARLHVKAV